MGRAGGTARHRSSGVRGDIAGERRCAAVGSWRFVLIQCGMRVESQLDWFARVRLFTSKSRVSYVYPLHSAARRLKEGMLRCQSHGIFEVNNYS